MEKGTFASSTGQELDKRVWMPEGAPKAIVQLVHGMAEHIDRYDAPARALCDAGYLVVGHTHLGHGPKAKIQGHFATRMAGIVCWRTFIVCARKQKRHTRACRISFLGIAWVHS